MVLVMACLCSTDAYILAAMKISADSFSLCGLKNIIVSSMAAFIATVPVHMGKQVFRSLTVTSYLSYTSNMSHNVFINSELNRDSALIVYVLL